MSSRRPYPLRTSGALKTSGIFDRLSPDRLFPIPEGQRLVAQGIYGEHRPLDERVGLVQEGRGRLAGEDQGVAIRREALEGFRAGAFAGGAGAVVLPMFTKALEKSIKKADERRLNLIADEVFSALTAPGSEGHRPDYYAARIAPADVSDAVQQSVRRATGMPLLPRADSDYLMLRHNTIGLYGDDALPTAMERKALELQAQGASSLADLEEIKKVIPELDAQGRPIRAKLFETYPAAYRRGTLDPQDFRNIGKMYLTASGGDAEVAGNRLAGLAHTTKAKFVDPMNPKQEFELPFRPRGEGVVHADRAQRLARRADIGIAEEALLGGAKRATRWLQTPLHPRLGELVNRIAAKGMTGGAATGTAALVLTPMARALTSRGAGIATGTGLLAAAAAAIKERMQAGKMYAAAHQPADEVAQELLESDRSTAEALAQGLHPENPLHSVGRGLRGMDINPAFLADTLSIATMADAGML